MDIPTQNVIIARNARRSASLEVNHNSFQGVKDSSERNELVKTTCIIKKISEV